MKQFLSFFLIVIMILSTAQAQVIEPVEYYELGSGIVAYDAYVLCDSLTLRAEPDVNSSSLRTLSYGQKLQVSMRQGEWYQVYLNESRKGWVRYEYILVNPAIYVTEKETPAYAYGSRYAPRVALLSAGERLPIIHSTAAYYVVSLRGASAWIEKPEAQQTEEFSLSKLQNVVLAQLCYTQPDTGTTLYIGEINDSGKLREMISLLSDADDMGAPISGCPFGRALLTLTYSDGSSDLLDLATDSCCIFRINGRDYSYARSLWTPEGGLTNSVLFSLFDGFPQELIR
ncbi:MAG: hypothetical protein E7319_10975 [Clostridiales bacterium]|nr:hypothetical protein [Clostridiales bacterium]